MDTALQPARRVPGAMTTMPNAPDPEIVPSGDPTPIPDPAPTPGEDPGVPPFEPQVEPAPL